MELRDEGVVLDLTVQPGSRPIVISVFSSTVVPRRAFGSRITIRATRPRRPLPRLPPVAAPGAARVSARSLAMWLGITRRSVRTSCHTAHSTRAKNR